MAIDDLDPRDMTGQQSSVPQGPNPPRLSGRQILARCGSILLILFGFVMFVLATIGIIDISVRINKHYSAAGCERGLRRDFPSRMIVHDLDFSNGEVKFSYDGILRDEGFHRIKTRVQAHELWTALAEKKEEEAKPIVAQLDAHVKALMDHNNKVSDLQTERLAMTLLQREADELNDKFNTEIEQVDRILENKRSAAHFYEERSVAIICNILGGVMILAGFACFSGAVAYRRRQTAAAAKLSTDAIAVDIPRAAKPIAHEE